MTEFLKLKNVHFSFFGQCLLQRQEIISILQTKDRNIKKLERKLNRIQGILFSCLQVTQQNCERCK